MPFISLLPCMLIKQQVSRAEAGVVPHHMPATQAQGWPCGTGEVIHTSWERAGYHTLTAISLYQVLEGRRDGKWTLSDSLTSHSLTQAGKSGKKHCASLGVETPTALSCASRMFFGCLSYSRLMNGLVKEGAQKTMNWMTSNRLIIQQATICKSYPTVIAEK